jgi:hypothetical protein
MADHSEIKIFSVGIKFTALCFVGAVCKFSPLIRFVLIVEFVQQIC